MTVFACIRSNILKCQMDWFCLMSTKPSWMDPSSLSIHIANRAHVIIRILVTFPWCSRNLLKILHVEPICMLFVCASKPLLRSCYLVVHVFPHFLPKLPSLHFHGVHEISWKFFMCNQVHVFVGISKTLLPLSCFIFSSKFAFCIVSKAFLNKIITL